MYELYKLMRDRQGAPNPLEPIKTSLNLKIPLRFMIDYFHTIKNDSEFLKNKSIDMDIFYYHMNKKQITDIAESYNIPVEEVEAWWRDKKYETLRKQSMTLVEFDGKFFPLLQKIFIDRLNFLEKGLIIKFWIQRPGQMAPLHYDRPKYLTFDLDTNQEKKIKRYIIFLDDQKEGQTFYMAGHHVSWKAGDVLQWDQTTYQHGSANFGYHDRPTLLVTGQEK